MARSFWVEMEIDSFGDLKRVLVTWTSFRDPDVYDVVGMWTLFMACVTNMRNNALPAELGDLADEMAGPDKEFLRELIR